MKRGAPPPAAAQALWRWPGAPIEPPNRGRGGVSEVLHVDLAGVHAYLKRQRGHRTRTWRAPLRGEPTLAREYRMLHAAAQAGVATPALLYFHAGSGPARPALLLTVALEGYLRVDPSLPAPARRAQLRAVAAAVARLHRAHIQHGCLYPKHLLVRPAGADWEVRLLDFEKARWRWSAARCARRDLDTLNRHAPGWSRPDRLRFLLAYRGERHLGRAGRRLWRVLARAARRPGG